MNFILFLDLPVQMWFPSTINVLGVKFSRILGNNNLGPWWSLLLSKLKCEDAFLLKRGSLVTEYYMNMSYMVDNDYGEYRDHLITRFGSLVVERRPLNRRDPGSIPDEFILRYEFYCLVSNVFASLTNGPGFDPHPDGCYIL
jgi:hypothetical protein